LELADDRQREALRMWLDVHDMPYRKVKAVTQLYDEIGVGAICEAKMQEYYQSATEILSRVSVEKHRLQILKDFAYELMLRET
jgi:geranylgeranyl diphosphate synthase type II